MISVLTPTIRPHGLQRVRRSLLKQTYKDFEWLVEVNSTGKPDLNTALNKMLRRAKGDLIVFIQDYISIPPDGLEQFSRFYTDNSQCFTTAPVGKAHNGIKWDWRIHRKGCDWREWEIDYGAAPKDALFKIGGFDERLDQYWGFDNMNAGLRAHRAGYTFQCLPNNKAIALDHDKMMHHPFRKLRNPDFHNMLLDDIRAGNWKNFI